jgi:hypothetical protein
MSNTVAPIALRNAPMEYAPMNELGVVFLFSRIAKRLQFRIVEIRPQFPDCIAYRRTGDKEKQCRIEFEFRSSSFKAHGHDPALCDMIVCWHYDWPDVPRAIEVIELKRFFGLARKVWIQQAIKSQQQYLDRLQKINWALSKRTTSGDLLLMYRCHPICAITDLFAFTGKALRRETADWREGDCFAGEITKICRLSSPVFLSDLRQHKVLQTASFVRRNMQGIGLQATEYWPYLYDMIVERNPAAGKALRTFRPEYL